MIHSTGEVLKLLNISKPTLYKLCKTRGIVPKRIGRNYRYSEDDLKLLLKYGEIDIRSVEDKFVSTINDVWFVLIKFAGELWGNEGESKLKEILLKNRQNIFILNVSNFEEIV